MPVSPDVRTTDRTIVFAHADALWERLRGALDERLNEPLNPSTDWTGHDVYAHLARWQELSIASLQRLMAGIAPEPPEADDDTLNQRWHAEDNALPALATRDRCIRTHNELQSLLMSLDENQWKAFGELYDDATGPHFEEHLAMIGHRGDA